MSKINLKLEPSEFKEFLFESINNEKTEFYKILKNEIQLTNINYKEFRFKDNEIMALIKRSPNSILPYIFIIYATGKVNLPHIQWMYISYLEKKNNLKEIAELKEQIIHNMEKTFPYLIRKKELPESLLKKYCINKKNSTFYFNLNKRIVDVTFNKLLKANDKIGALEIALQAYIKFDDEFMLFQASKIIYDLKETNDALKVLILVTYIKPLEPNTIMYWGNVSINMVSNRNYWIAQLGFFLYPEICGILVNLSACLSSLGEFNEAKILLQKAIKMPESSPSYSMNYANILMSEGRPDLAVEILENLAKKEKNFNDKINSNLLFISQYDSKVDYLKLKNLHVTSSKNISNKYKRFRINDNKKIKININSKIRLGFVSFDLINHPVAYFMYSLIKNLSIKDFEIYIYYTRQRKDPVTKLFIDIIGDRFIDISNLNLIDQNSLISKMNIDLLIDLSGHTAGNSLELFAMKPARYQATYLGYPFTVGLEEINYRFSDLFYPKDDNFYTEKRIDVEGSCICYQPMLNKMELLNSEMYAVKEPPVVKNGYITFGLSTNPGKINEQVVEVFSNILKITEKSKLLVEANGFDDMEYVESYKNRFTNFGISAERIILIPRNSAKQYLIYNEIDIALDPFPYNGGTSTMDLLWMGLPLVTLEGKVGMSAVGAAMLKHLGKFNNIAVDKESYINIASKLANNIDFLIEERMSQRAIMENSNLMNQSNYGIRFGDAIKKIVMQ